MTKSFAMGERILVIKLGALGDLVLCSAAFAAIRQRNPDATIMLMTAPAFAAFGLQMPWFDGVILDARPKMTQPLKWIKLIREVRRFAPTRVYDFQGKFRQSILFRALGRPAWSGAAKGCSDPRPWPMPQGAHYTDLLAAQLKAVWDKWDGENGETRSALPAPEMSWLDGDLSALSLPKKYAVLIVGCSPQHPHKRWPAASYADLAQRLAAQGIACVAVGTKADAGAIDALRVLAPEVIGLAGKTSLGQLAALARRAEYVVGNDTGPTHLAAAVGAKTLALLSDKVNPNWSAPKGERAQWLQGNPLETLSVDAVWKKLSGDINGPMK